MNEEEFEAILQYVGIISLFLMAGIMVVAALLMETAAGELLVLLLGLVSVSLGFASGWNGYNRRFWNLFNFFDSPSFDERKEALYGGDDA